MLALPSRRAPRSRRSHWLGGERRVDLFGGLAPRQWLFPNLIPLVLLFPLSVFMTQTFVRYREAIARLHFWWRTHARG